MSATCEVCYTGGPCGQPAVQTMTTACMHGHTETFAACQRDVEDAWKGALLCTPCNEEHGTEALALPQVLHRYRWEQG